MQLLKIIFLTYSFIYIKGQATDPASYYCTENNFTIQITLSFASHSAWEPSLNCSLSSCHESLSNNNNSCRSTLTPCFDYRTISNVSYCAPASLCSILEPCNNITNECVSNTSVCVVNSCCIPKAVCLPLLWSRLCQSLNDTYSSTTAQSTIISTTITTTSAASAGTTTTNTITTTTA